MPAAPDSAPARCRVALCKDNAQQANPRPHALDLHHRNRTASLRRNLLMSFAALSLTIGLLLLHPLNHALHFESLTKVVVLVSLFSVGLETGPPIVRPALVVAMAMGDMLTPVAPPANGVGFLALLLRVIRSAWVGLRLLWTPVSGDQRFMSARFGIPGGEQPPFDNRQRSIPHLCTWSRVIARRAYWDV